MYGGGECIAVDVFFWFGGDVAMGDGFDGDELFVDFCFCSDFFISTVFCSKEFTIGGEGKALGEGC